MNRHAFILLCSLSAITFVWADTDAPTSSLLSACQSNNLTGVQESLAQGADVNAVNDVGFTPLLYAVTAGNREMTELLLEKGASLDVNDPLCRCPVIIAVQKGNVEILKTLAAHGGDLQHRHVITRGDAQTPLHIAVQNNDITMVKYLLSEKVSIEARNSDGESALATAATLGDLKMVKLLVENGANLYTNRGYGGSLLSPDHYQLTPAIRRYLQETDEKRSFGHQEPGWSVFIKRIDMFSNVQVQEIERYLQKGGDPQGVDKDGMTLLHHLAGTTLRNMDILKSILELPETDINAADKLGNTPLHMACLNDCVENVEMMLASGANIEARNADDQTPLISLAIRYHSGSVGEKEEVQIATLLLQHGANVNAVDAFGNTGLHYLAYDNMDKHLGFTRLLIEHSANLDCQNYTGDTFLHRAAEMGTAAMMRLAIEAGANLDIRNYYGKSITDCARYDSQEKIDLFYTYKQNISVLEAAYYSQDDILESLIGQGADINMTKDYDNSATALMIAAKRNDPTMVQTVLKLGGKINAQDTLGNTALHYAAKFGHDSVVTSLLSNQADVTIYNKEGWRAVDLAGLENRRRVIQLFRDIYPDISPSRKPILAQPGTTSNQTIQIVSTDGNIDEATLKEMLIKLSSHIDLNTDSAVPDSNAIKIQISREENNWKTSFYTAMSGNPFHFAVIRGDTEKVQTMLKDGQDIHTIDDAGILPLNYAVLMENKDMIDLLLKNGTDINRLDSNIDFANVAGVWGLAHTVGEKAGWGAIHYAVADGSREILDYLISKSADLNLKDIEGGRSTIFLAVLADHPDLLKILIQAGADLSSKNNNDRTLLHSVAASGKIDYIKLLLELGADIDVGKPDTTPLMEAAEAGKDDAMIFLMENGADIDVLNQKAGDIISSLIAASYTSETLKILIEYGIDVNAKNSKGQPPLFCLFNYGGEMKNGLRDNVQLLLDAGLDLNATDKEGNTILHYAASKCSLPLAQMMIAHGIDVNCSNNEGKTPLDMMFGPIFRNSDYDELFRLLAEKNTHLNDQDQYGRNALHNAAIKGSPDLVRFLASKEVDIENRANDSFDNRTPLHSAIRERHVDVIRTLLDLGTDLEARDNKQRTPLITAAWIDHVDSVRVLLDYQADCNAQDKNGQTPLHHALSTRGRDRDKDIIQLLLTAGARTDIPNRYKLTPIELAQRMNKPEIMELFQ